VRSHALKGKAKVSAVLGAACGVLFLSANARAAVPHPTHPPHPGVSSTPPPFRNPHPTHPVANPTPLPQHPQHGGGSGTCPGVPVACPAQAPCQAGAKVSKLFYAYPGRDRNLTASGFFTMGGGSNGIDPLSEGGSLSLTDDDGNVILEMPQLQFSQAGGSFVASNEQGMVQISPLTRGYAFSFIFESPQFPPRFFVVRYHLCLNIGDDGIWDSVVCQKKPGGGFLCHQ
jgi:hypothetical protein